MGQSSQGLYATAYLIFICATTITRLFINAILRTSPFNVLRLNSFSLEKEACPLPEISFQPRDICRYGFLVAIGASRAMSIDERSTIHIILCSTNAPKLAERCVGLPPKEFHLSSDYFIGVGLKAHWCKKPRAKAWDKCHRRQSPIMPFLIFNFRLRKY